MVSLNMTNNDCKHISYVFVMLCMLILLVIQVHIIERQHYFEGKIEVQDKVIAGQNRYIAQLERDIRLITQEVECLNNIIVRGDYTNDQGR